MNTVHKSFMEDAVTIMVHAFITSRLDHCNSVLHHVSSANVQPLRNVLNGAARIILYKRKFDHIITLLTFKINYIGCPFSSVSNTKCVSWCTSVCIRLHQLTLLNCAHRCLNQPAVVNAVLLCGVTWQYHASEHWDTAKNVSLFPDQPCGTHCLWQFITHHWHWLSIWNTSLAPLWQLGLQGLLREYIFTYLLNTTWQFTVHIREHLT